jgi:hypothetical protein
VTHGIDQRSFQLTLDHYFEAALQVKVGVIRSIRAVYDRADATRAGGLRDFEGEAPVRLQAHLRQEIEIILAHGDDIGAEAIQHGSKIAIKCHIKECDLHSVCTKGGRAQ